jgi:hypothetical protein
MYQSKTRLIDAFEFNGRNGREALAWAGMRGGELTYNSAFHKLHFHTLEGSTKWSAPQVIEANTYLVKDDGKFYTLDPAQFNDRFVEYTDKAKDEKPSVIKRKRGRPKGTATPAPNS